MRVVLYKFYELYKWLPRLMLRVTRSGSGNDAERIPHCAPAEAALAISIIDGLAANRHGYFRQEEGQGSWQAKR